MNAGSRLGAYAIGLVVVFGVATGAGRVLGPDAAKPAAGHSDMTGGPEAGGHGESAAHLPGGLQIAQDGYRLTPLTSSLPVGAAEPFAFRILGPDGRAVTGYTREHDKDLHLIVVRRDLSGFQHVHPSLAPDGTWSIPLAVAAAGDYRVLADFTPAGRADGLTLGADVPAAGDYRPAELPAPSRTATVDDYTVTLDGTLVPGKSSPLTLTVSRAGKPVTDLERYLDAYGHLVALRSGDLAYLHVHPVETSAAGPGIGFVAEVPSAGTYRLYLDFQHGGTVRTAEFTMRAEASHE